MHDHDHQGAARQDGAPAGGVAAEQGTKAAFRGPVQSFKAVLASWKRHWKLFTGISALGSAAVLAALIVGGVIAVVSIALTVGFSETGMAEGGASLLGNPLLVAVLVLAALLTFAAILVFSSWMTLSTMTAWGWVTREEHHLMSVRNAYRSSWALVPGYIWISILSLLVIVIGMIGFIVPGILLSLCFMVVPAIAAAEGAKGGAALRRSIALSWPRLPAITWRLLVAGIAVYAPGTIAGGIIDAILAPGSDSGPGDLLVQLYEIVATPVFLGAVYVTYLDLLAVSRVEKKGGVKLIKIAAICAAIAAVLAIVLIAVL